MRAQEFVNEEWSEKYKRSINCSNPKGFSQKAHCAGRKKNEDLNEFAPDEGGGSRKFIPWPEFIEQVKQIVSKDFSCKENIVKSTIKARFIPHDPMEYGPTMLYSYYETRAGGRNKGAISTRGSIQVGKYTKGGLFGQSPDQLLTGFHLLKGHPFERHFDLTFDNIYKIANIILGNTEGALEFKPEQQVNEFAPGSNPGGGNYLKALASAWYNDTFNTGDLHKGIKSQEDVEKILARGIHCGDGKVRKYSIGYNANFDGVEIQSDDHYEYSDYDDAGNDIDSRTGKPWGPYDVVAFGDNELDESQLNELTFRGSQCTKDCSGHAAGYEWSKRKGGVDAASWSPSFNKGAALFKNGY